MRRTRRLAAIAVAFGGALASVALLGSSTAGAAYAANGEPVWIPRNANNTADLLRANNQGLAKLGNKLYLGGDFTEIAPELGAPAIQQGYLAAFNAAPTGTGNGTGVPLAAFAPQLDGPVYAIVADPVVANNRLFVGGAFTGGFAILDATTGLPSGAQPTTDGEVHALYLDGRDLYVGGQFQKFGGQSNRKMMARMNVDTLVVDGFAPAFVGGMVAAIDIPPDHSKVFAGGRFTTLNGAQVGKVVALKLDGTLEPAFGPAYTNAKQPVEDVEATDAKVFVAFGGGYNRFVQFSASGNMDFGSCGDGDVQEVHLIGTLLLVGGHFSGGPKKNCTLETIPTARIAEYDVSGALPVVVNPTPFSSVYANELGVWEFLGTSMTDVWVAGDFLKVSSRNTGGLAHFFDGTTYTDGQSPSTPANLHVTGQSPGSITVAWNASTDNKAVGGYYVHADGVRRAVSTGLSATVPGLNPGQAYNLQVQAFDVKLNVSALSAGVPGTTETDTTPPNAPTNLRVLNGSTSELVLAWNAATDNGTVAEYQVFADGNLLGTTASLTMAHGNLNEGSQHTYHVLAKDAAGNLSDPSTTLTARAYTIILAAGATWSYYDQGSLPDFAWREPGYVPPGQPWPTGRSPLGYGKPYIATALGWGPNNNNRYLTSYARTTFNLADPSGVTGLNLRIRGLDGAAVFINSKLAYNDNLPAALEPDLGALTNRNTQALDVIREFRVPVTSGMLVAGTNVVAVEFHKYDKGASYLAFDTDISAGLPAVNQPPPDAPQNLAATVVTGPKVQLAWDAVATANSYNVYRNGTLIGSPATNAFEDTSPPSTMQLDYTVRAVDSIGQESGDSNTQSVTITPPDAPANLAGSVQPGPSVPLTWDPSAGAASYVVRRNGNEIASVPTPGYTDSSPPTGSVSYTVRAVDSIGQQSADSNTLTVTVNPPPPPDIVKPTKPGTPVKGTVTDTSIALTWPASTDNVGVTGYRIWRGGVALPTTTPTNSFTDTGLSPNVEYKYQITAFDAAGNASGKSTALKVKTAMAGGGGTTLSMTTDWSYTETRVDLGTAWRTTGYTIPVPGPWKTGKPQFGFGDGDETTVTAHGGTTNSTAVLTWYYRTTFEVTDVNAISSFLGQLVRDDGAIVYINGNEVYRSNMPAGSPIYTTKASSSLGGADEHNPVAFSVPKAAAGLVTGTNVIAVEVHNAGPSNGDASFQLTASLA